MCFHTKRETLVSGWGVLAAHQGDRQLACTWHFSLPFCLTLFLTSADLYPQFSNADPALEKLMFISSEVSQVGRE